MAESVQVLKDKLVRARNQIANIREEVAHATEMVTDSVLVASGGAVAAVLDAKMPKIPGTELDSKLIVGSLMCGMASFGGAGDYSRQLNAIGGGLLAVEAHAQVTKMLAK